VGLEDRPDGLAEPGPRHMGRHGSRRDPSEGPSQGAVRTAGPRADPAAAGPPAGARAGGGVPRDAYIRLCVLHRLLQRYHNEWSHALRWVYVPELSECSIEDGPDSPSESDDLQGALARLMESDRQLIDRLYWRGETESEVGSSLGISQQAVSKRKRSVLRKLHRLLNPSGRR
jgi:RNA polymerase sigma factor (sigma-70 family)